MNLQQALEVLARVASHDHQEHSLVIEVFSPGTVGGTPCVPVRSIDAGFDWDRGRVIVRPQAALSPLTAEDLEAIRASVKQAQTWHTWQVLKRQKERYEAKIAQLERQLAEATGSDWKSRASDRALHG
jgi:hypothetical protein